MRSVSHCLDSRGHALAGRLQCMPAMPVVTLFPNRDASAQVRVSDPLDQVTTIIPVVSITKHRAFAKTIRRAEGSQPQIQIAQAATVLSIAPAEQPEPPVIEIKPAEPALPAPIAPPAAPAPATKWQAFEDLGLRPAPLTNK